MSKPNLAAVLAAGGLALAGFAAAAQPAGAPVGEVVIVAPRAVATSPDVEVRSRVVSWADLDLTNRFGARTLLTRVHAAVRSVCSPPARPIELAEAADYKLCVRESLHRALADVDDAILGRPG